MKQVLERAWRLVRFEGGLPVVWIALTCFALYPVWHSRLLPMLDTPNHLALARGWHEYNDPASRVAEYFDLRVRMVPYWLFYGSIHMLMYLFQIETANKIFLSAYLILFPLSVLALARALGRSPWLAVFAFPLAFNQNWIYGFASYLMSVTLAFFSLAALLRYVQTRRAIFALSLGLTTTLCYLSHIMPWALFGLCAIAVLLVYCRNWQAGLVAAAVMMPSVLMAVTAIIDERHDRTYIKDAPFQGTFYDFHTSVWTFPKRVMELFPGSFDGTILVVLLVTLAGLLAWSRWRPADCVEPDVRVQHSVKLVLWILVLAYLALPYAITKPMSWWYVAPRLPSMILAVFVLYPAVRLTGWRRLALVPVVVCAIALPLKLGALYRNFSSRNIAAMRLIEETPRGALTLLVVRNMMRGSGSEEKSGDPASAGPVYWHFAEWPMALRGGYSAYVFDQGIPIKPKKKVTTPAFGTTDNFQFRQAPDYEYYIVRDAPEEMDREPSVQVVRKLGDWTLFKRIHDFSDEP